MFKTENILSTTAIKIERKSFAKYKCLKYLRIFQKLHKIFVLVTHEQEYFIYTVLMKFHKFNYFIVINNM